MRHLWIASLLVLLGHTVGADLPDNEKTHNLRVVVWTENLAELYAVKPGAQAGAGLEAELLEGFAALRGLKLELVPVATLDARIPALLKGQGDVLAGGIVNTESRRKQVDFTIELFPIRHMVVTRKPHPAVASVEQLRAERVGTIKGSSWAEEVKAAGVPATSIDDSFGSADEMMAGMRSGTVSAVVMSAVWAIVEARKDPGLELGVLIGAPTSVGYAVRKDEPLLRQALDEYIGNVRRTPTWSRLVVKYFGESGLEILKKSRQP